MKKLYTKKENGRYEEYGFAFNREMSDGIWIVQSKPGVVNTSSVVWKIGDLKKPTDVTTHAAIQSMGDDLASYLMKLKNEDSEELKEAKEIMGGYIRGAIQIGNISVSDLTQLFLRKIALILDKI